MVTYNIKNRGTTKATDVKLQYSNTSDEKENSEGRTVLLEGVTTAIINLGDIAENNKEMGDRQLAVDFKYADKATFKFNVLYNETLITQETKIETFEARPIRLKLVPITPLNLIGAHQEVRFKIEHDPQSRPLTNIDISKLELAVINELDNEAYFWHTDNKEEDLKGLAVNKLIDDIGNELILHIETGSAKEAEFILELTYKRLPITNTSPSHITWKEATLAIQESSDFVNDNTATFTLKNLNTAELIDPKSITIQLVSNNTAEFTLLKSDNSEAGSSTNLSQLIGDNLLRPNTPTNPIQFKLTNAQGGDNAIITIIAKRGNVELAKQTVRWENQPISMQLITEEKRFKDQDSINFGIQNNGPSTHIDKIKMYLTNNQGIKFKLTTNAKNITGDNDNIDISLKDILNLDKLEKGTIVYFKLELADNPNNTYVAQLVLEIQVDNQPLDTTTLVWVNNEELTSIPANLQREMDTYLENFLRLQENIDKQIRERNDDPLSFYENIDQLSTNQNSGQSLQSGIEWVLNNIKEQCKDIDKQDYPPIIDSLKIRLEQVLTNLKKQDTAIDNLIIKSLNHAKEQIEKLAKETETTSSQDVTSGSTNIDKMEGWLSILTIVADGEIVLEAKEIANNIIKELEENKNKQTSVQVTNITKTPEKRSQTQQKLLGRARKNPRVRELSYPEMDKDAEENSDKSVPVTSRKINNPFLRPFPGMNPNIFRANWGPFPGANSYLLKKPSGLPPDK